MERDDREDVKEHTENEEELDRKIKKLGELIKESKHVVFYTGAGVSTSAKIPDFRGPKGVWTLREKGEMPKMEITMEQAQPTLCHMALVELQNQNILKYLVSQNVDGLHRRSGIKPELLSELHGNIYLEICEECGTEYLRNFSVTEHAGTEVNTKGLQFREMSHMTGRRCKNNGCKGILRDSIVNFGESLPSYSLKKAKKESKESDLGIVLGSSLTVTPASDLPRRPSKLVIVNLQKTSLDNLCFEGLRIFAKTDIVMQKLMNELGITIPSFEEKKMTETLIYQPTDPEARVLRKPEPAKPPIINLTSISGPSENSQSSCALI